MQSDNNTVIEGVVTLQAVRALARTRQERILTKLTSDYRDSGLRDDSCRLGVACIAEIDYLWSDIQKYVARRNESIQGT